MTTSKTILISTLATSLLVLAGCTTQTTTDTNVTDTNTTVNTNAIANTNTTNDDTNDVVANENTNVEQGTEVDTSDWLTYTNDEYGFSFKYPEEWDYEIGAETLPEGDAITILFLSPDDKIIKTKSDYTDLPLGYKVIVFSTNLSPSDFARDRLQNQNFEAGYSEIIYDHGLKGVKYWEPGLSEGAYVKVFQLKATALLQVISFSQEVNNSETFRIFVNSLRQINKS